MVRYSLRAGLLLLGIIEMFLFTQGLDPTIVYGDEKIKSSLGQGAATITIAASDSLPQSKANATYVCDGTDDNVEIQAAIDSLPEAKGKETWHSIGGGSIQLLEGTFNIGATIKFYDKPVSLLGTGRYSTSLMLQKEVNADMLLIGTGKAQGIPAGRLAHMTLNGQSVFQTKGSGIRMKSGDMVVIEHVRVYDFKEHGIFLDGTSPAIRPCVGTIENCRIEYNKKHGIYFGPGSEGWMIKGNWIGDNGTTGEAYHGIFIQSLYGVPAEAKQPGGASNSYMIIGNLIWQNRCTQISIDGGAHIMITGNMILSSPYENIKLYGGAHLITITDNAIHSANEFGKGAPHITLGESPTSIARHVVISGNVFSTPSRGLPSTQMAEAGVAEAGSGDVTMPQPPAILIEKPGSDYNRFIGNVIDGEVTNVILVGAHSSTDNLEEVKK